MGKRYFYVIILLGLIAILAGAAFYTYEPLKNSIILGLDIRGGVSVLLEAVESEGSAKIDDDAMSRAEAIISNRVDGLGVAEPQIYREGANRIRVALPEYGEGEGDQEKILKLLGQTALLEFRDMDGNVFLTGANLIDAREQWDGNSNTAYVQLKLDGEGGTKMLAYTETYKGTGYLDITLDGITISRPTIESAVGAEGSISHIPTLEQARDLAIMLRSGALPVTLEMRDFRAIGPSLGTVSLQKSIFAGLVGIVLVLLYMIVIYRVAGLLANVALILYGFLTLWVLVFMGAALTLPGITGLILGVGMALDANVIIFERIKDELRLGHSLRSAIRAGFSRAMLTVLDSNVTTLIAGGVLYYFGTGAVRGFAVTLSLGIVVSMFTAVFFTRWLIDLLVKSNALKPKLLLGLGEVVK